MAPDPHQCGGPGLYRSRLGAWDGNRVRLITRTLADPPLEGRIHSFNTLLELDCAMRSARALHLTGYDALGVVIEELGPDPRPEPTAQGSAFAEILQEFCRS